MRWQAPRRRRRRRESVSALFKWDRTRAAMAAGDLQHARDVLLESLATYSQTNGVRVVAAFDAMGSPGAAAMGTREDLLSSGVTAVYCGDQEADSFIEGQVSVWLARGCQQVVVATSDGAQQAVVDSKPTRGRQVCFVVPSSGLIKDIEATEKRLKERLEELDRPSMSLLGSVVKSKDRDAFSVMQAMRTSLPPPPGAWTGPGPGRGRGKGARGGSAGSGSDSDEGGGTT